MTPVLVVLLLVRMQLQHLQIPYGCHQQAVVCCASQVIALLLLCCCCHGCLLHARRFMTDAISQAFCIMWLLAHGASAVFIMLAGS
jgi:hypothetical protein